MTLTVTFLLLLFLAVCPFFGEGKIDHAVAQLKASIPDIRNTPVAGKVDGRKFTPEKAWRTDVTTGDGVFCGP